MAKVARAKSRSRWLQDHLKDPYVQLAQQEGYRSRAVYKLKEMQARDRFIKPGMTVIELGAAPGGWSQYLSQVVGKNGTVIATDILPMESLPGIVFIQGDFRDQQVLNHVLATLGERKADLVISDMAPNISGIKAVDQPRSMYLAELTFDLARHCLVTEGNLLLKVFQGEGFDTLRRELQVNFAKVFSRKPRSSRPRSPEIYLLAKNYQPTGKV